MDQACRPLLLRTLLLSVICGCIGCNQAKRFGQLPPQSGGRVTYSCSTPGEPTFEAGGSAQYVRTFASKTPFDRLPHITYIVFRDEDRAEDHLVTIQARGNVQVIDSGDHGQVAITDQSGRVVVKVKKVQSPVTVVVDPTPVEIFSYAGGSNDSGIVLTSDGRVRLKRPSLFTFDERFGLDEVQSIVLSHNAVSDGATMTFAVDQKAYAVEFASTRAADDQMSILSPLVGAIAPHVALSTTSAWWTILKVIGGAFIVLLILSIIGIAKKT